jgi:hypothetical protein
MAKSLSKTDEKKLLEFYRTAFELRGYFLDQCIWLERTLNEVLASYFCGIYSTGNKRRQILLNEVFASQRIRIQVKTNMLETILKNGNYIKRSEAETLISTLKDIIDFRNKISYRLVNASLAINKRYKSGIIELEYEGSEGRIVERVTPKIISDKLERISDILEDLVSIQEKIEQERNR